MCDSYFARMRGKTRFWITMSTKKKIKKIDQLSRIGTKNWSDLNSAKKTFIGRNRKGQVRLGVRVLLPSRHTL